MATKVDNGLDLQNQKIISVADPSSAQDVATKNYIDTSLLFVLSSNLLTTGESTHRRDIGLANGTAISNQILYLNYFTAQKTESITTVVTYTGTTPAGATPTLCQVAIYSVAPNGDLTLITSTANDTSLWAAANTAYSKSWQSTWSKVKNTRYAAGVLVNTAAALPNFTGPSALNSSVAGVILGKAPALFTQLASQTSIPSSITAASLTSPNPAPRSMYMEFS